MAYRDPTAAETAAIGRISAELTQIIGRFGLHPKVKAAIANAGYTTTELFAACYLDNAAIEMAWAAVRWEQVKKPTHAQTVDHEDLGATYVFQRHRRRRGSPVRRLLDKVEKQVIALPPGLSTASKVTS